MRLGTTWVGCDGGLIRSGALRPAVSCCTCHLTLSVKATEKCPESILDCSQIDRLETYRGWVTARQVGSRRDDCIVGSFALHIANCGERAALHREKPQEKMPASQYLSWQYNTVGGAVLVRCRRAEMCMFAHRLQNPASHQGPSNSPPFGRYMLFVQVLECHMPRAGCCKVAEAARY